MDKGTEEEGRGNEEERTRENPEEAVTPEQFR
jgi:hypothetical protein